MVVLRESIFFIFSRNNSRLADGLAVYTSESERLHGHTTGDITDCGVFYLRLPTL